jgi:hypothetical protein
MYHCNKVLRKVNPKKEVPSMLRSLFYLLGSAVFAIILDSKLYDLTGKHLMDIIGAVARLVALVVKGGS